MATEHVEKAASAPGDAGAWALAGSIWPLMAGVFVAALPATAAGFFLASIAADVGSSVAVVGSARGLGGLTALLAGVLAAPVIDRLPRAWSIAGGLVVLGVASALASAGSLTALLAFYLLAGGAGSVLGPALQAASADRVNGSEAARAASLLASMGSLAAVLAGPLLAFPAVYWGWRGDYLAIAAACAALAVVAAFTQSRRRPAGVARLSYWAAFRAVSASPGALPLLLGSTMRACAFMAWLTYVAAFYTERFQTSPASLSLVWLTGAGSFFVASVLAGRLANVAPGEASAWTARWREPERLLLGSLCTTAVTGPVLFLSHDWSLALAATAAYGGAMGVALVSFVSLLVRRYQALRGAVMGLNTAGFNLGLFAGTAAAGLGLAVGGYPGLALVMGALGAATVLAVVWATRAAGAGTPLPAWSQAG